MSRKAFLGISLALALALTGLTLEDRAEASECTSGTQYFLAGCCDYPFPTYQLRLYECRNGYWWPTENTICTADVCL
jgi:hypothetical protein